mgnify:FL=1
MDALLSIEHDDPNAFEAGPYCSSNRTVLHLVLLSMIPGITEALKRGQPGLLANRKI